MKDSRSVAVRPSCRATANTILANFFRPSSASCSSCSYFLFTIVVEKRGSTCETCVSSEGRLSSGTHCETELNCISPKFGAAGAPGFGEIFPPFFDFCSTPKESSTSSASHPCFPNVPMLPFALTFSLSNS